jgi:hypothetical protein
MKYIALLIVLGFMGWTWSLAQGQREFGLAESREMEGQIQDIITDYVKSKHPEVTNLRFLQLFTEVVQPSHEMRVHVRYIVEAPTSDKDSSEQTFQGVVILKSEDGKTWAWAGQDVHAPIVEFKNGIKVAH